MSQLGLFETFEKIDVAYQPVELTLDEKVSFATDLLVSYIRLGYTLVCSTSFGKDSSVMLDISIKAILKAIELGLKPETLHVINSNTQLENPAVEDYAYSEISKLESFAEENAIPLKVWIAYPSLSNNYLVNIIGGRTIASVPGSSAKCQQMLKAEPLKRIRSRLVNWVKEKQRQKFDENKILSLVGTRFDESVVRGNAMRARQESAFKPVKNDVIKTWTLSPIAEFSTDDIFTYIGEVVSEKRARTYSDFEQLLEMYRDSNGGECMVNMYYGSGSAGGGNTACGARHGCWVCTRVGFDRSMENLLSDPRYSYMKGLNNFRNYLLACHHDLDRRNWLSRRIEDDGTIGISPVAYSPEFCLELLKLILTIDAQEEEAAAKLGISPRFKSLTQKDILGIDILWNRYGYQKCLAASEIYKKVYIEGKRYPVPEIYPQHQPQVIPKTSYVHFADEEYNDTFYGFRYLDMAVIDQENVVEKNGELYSNVNVAQEFEIDDEGAELFFGFELDYALERFSGYNYNPTAAIDYLFNLGVVSINKGGHSEWDRILRVANQVYRHGIRDILNNPNALIKHLSGDKHAGVNGQQSFL